MVNPSAPNMGKSSETGGVKPMSIAGRLVNERERLLGMTDAERAFRKQWLKDQELSPNEPRHVPELERGLLNPIRRFYRWPLDQVEKMLVPMVGKDPAFLIRIFTGRGLLALGGIYWMAYYIKYNGNDWQKKCGLKITNTREAIVPGDPGYPYVPTKTKSSEYATRGFEKVTLNL